jgi:ribosomal protein S7
MGWGDDINSAIARRDTTALRRIAERARRKEGAMFLGLVAELVELEQQNTTQLNKKSA